MGITIFGYIAPPSTRKNKKPPFPKIAKNKKAPAAKRKGCVGCNDAGSLLIDLHRDGDRCLIDNPCLCAVDWFYTILVGGW